MWIHIKMVIYIQQGSVLSFYSYGHFSCYVLDTLRARCPAQTHYLLPPLFLCQWSQPRQVSSHATFCLENPNGFPSPLE